MEWQGVNPVSLQELIRVRALPDELATGHAGRLSDMNGYPSAHTFLNACRCLFPGRDLSNLFKQDKPIKFLGLRLLAILNGQEFEAYAAAHSMVKSFPSFLTGTLEDASMYYGLSPQRAFAYLCEDCARADRIAFGFSYWRRSHHLVGREYCATHPTSRLKRVDSALPFERCPLHWINLGCAIDDPIIEDLEYRTWLKFVVEYEQSALDNPYDRSRELQVLRRAPRALPDTLLYEMGLGERWEEEGRPSRKNWPRASGGIWYADDYARLKVETINGRVDHLSSDDAPSPRA